MATAIAVDGDRTGRALEISGSGFTSTEALTIEVVSTDGDNVVTGDVTCSSGNFTLDEKVSVEHPGVLRVTARNSSSGAVRGTLEQRIFIGN